MELRDRPPGQLRDRSHLPEEPLIATVTFAELSVGPLVTDDESGRALRQARLQVTEAPFEPIPFDAPAARGFVRVAAELRGSRRPTKAGSFDAIIAATASSRNLPIFTGRAQPVIATSSASFSDGFMNPSVSRGRLLRLAANRARSSALCTERSVPFGMY